MSRDLDRGRDRDRDRSRSRDRNSDPESSSSLLVRNLSYNITSSDIRRLMEKYGEIRDVYIPTDYHTRRPRGFAFVEFFDHRDARYERMRMPSLLCITINSNQKKMSIDFICRSALHALDRYLLDGRELGVVFAKDKRKTPVEMRQIDRPRSKDRGSDRNRGGYQRDRDNSRDRDRGRDRERDSRRK